MMQASIWPYGLLAIALHVLLALCFVQAESTKTMTLAGEGGQGVEVGIDEHTTQRLISEQTNKQNKAKLEQKNQQQVPQKKASVKKRVQKTAVKQETHRRDVVKPAVIQKTIAPQPKQQTETGVLTATVQTEKQQEVNEAKPEKTHVAMLSTTNAISQPALVQVASHQATANHTDKASSNSASSRVASSKSIGSAKAMMKSDVFKAYIRKIMSHLKRYKTYPKALKQAHMEGTPVIKFTINQSGEVIETTIKRRSSNQALDQAAIDVFKKANPLPPIPPSMKQDSLTMSLPIKYRLIND